MSQSLVDGPRSPSSKKRKPEREALHASPTKKQRKEKERSKNIDAKSTSNGVGSNADPSSHAASSVAITSQESTTQIPTSTDSTDEPSPLCMETYSMYLPLAPICQTQPLDAICAEHLSPLLLAYHHRMKAVVLAYENVRLSDDDGSQDATIQSKAVNEQASTFVWATADFLLFRPKRGQQLEGWITLQNDSHIGLTCWNLINASIERKRLPESWTWIDHVLVEGEDFSTVPSIPKGKHGSGHYIDGKGRELGDTLSFTVADYEYLWMSEAERGLLRIEGTLLDDIGEESARETTGKRRTHGKGSKAGTIKKTSENGRRIDMKRRSILKERPAAS
ncbi:hypothetical protein P152DRAFT_22311 [Eremomyces bilateralis CBS 781.70]|uniref:DNA-directed RNA polymerase subunit n=1 Tax=Eremomyces bilateralis CBS 781.70 TaxID=1392243 RepID=A0A6G1GHI7_9PEZI|nr:uncharacterized protein P152DRAFT_22311 [Eremomyces bilateralis CBS 781.70]KAF1817538.1 hypothetical protein P152DRAFT_22311 [Eremomyces bilateralis CBS 781.70]